MILLSLALLACVKPRSTAEFDQAIDCIIYGWLGSDWGERRSEVRFRGQTGKHLLVVSLSAHDPWLRENVLDVMILLAICGGNR